ncbi:MAG TPA: acyl carrier protein [Iamia sp.]|jgi:acyl carrier protein|nr:acyl carrier protein [Iamia sp.]
MNVDREELYDLIVATAADGEEIDLSTVARDADLVGLGFDSLHFTTLLIEVEERLGDEITPEAFDRFADLEVFSLDAILDALIGPARPRSVSGP